MGPLEIETPHGLARAHLTEAKGAVSALVLGHGAGGGVEAPDLLAARDAAVGEGVSVALVEQPYLVAGRKAPAPPKQLDANFIAAVEALRCGSFAGLGLITGGRSLGARVACRTAAEAGARAVLCLAFPVRPPRRKGSPPKPGRIAELDAVRVPVLVVQGKRDQFGQPTPGPERTIASVAGNHSLRADLPAVGAAVAEWLRGVGR